MDIQKIRDDFPILQEVIYLDNASTSLTPEPVLASILEYYRKYNASVGRGIHRLSQMAEQKYRSAHLKVGGFIGAKEGELAFTKNTTESINTVAFGLKWKKGDRVVTTLIEHHSNFLPWLHLEQNGVVALDTISPAKDGTFQSSDFEEAIGEGTKLVAVTQMSNVLGTILPIKEISETCRDKGAMLLVDGAQSVPHMPVEVRDLGCDFLCFSGHKMLGPTGIGALWMGRDIKPLMLGGGTVVDASVDSYELKPGYERFEAGTPNICGGIGLARAVDYLTDLGMEEVRAHEIRLTRRMLEGLWGIEGVDIYGPLDPGKRGSVVSFNVKDMMPHDVSLMLDEASSIMTRSGHHCCMPLMKHLGLKNGTVRASLYIYNTEEEIDKFLSTVEMIAKMG
jgi:cysteine desulfurase/selenocysteine lyase